MIRVSEMVFAGHPDKYCDQVADAIIAECMNTDRDAYGQVEVAAWSDQVWLSGGVCTRQPLKKAIDKIVVETGRAVGYTEDNWVNAQRYKVTNTICELIDDPKKWTAKVNDQAVVVGWAGYGESTHYLPPEHYLAHVLREAVNDSCRGGRLAGHGPDGKLMVRMKEQSSAWEVEHVLMTLQQKEKADLLEVCAAIERTLEDAYDDLRERDGRWVTPWKDVQLMLNPNGPLINGGSDGDNGQTGRKLTMDFYGPRIPIGGGALSGKHLSHVDRVGAYAAREAAVRAVQSGAQECLVRLAYAPNRNEPLDISYEMVGRGGKESTEFFEHSEMVSRYSESMITTEMAQGRHFFDADLAWNRLV